MIRKIFLEGELGHKFTPVLNFEGETVAEALRCIGANYPDFRKYLIDANEADIGFSIQVQGRDLEDPVECLLNLSEGDIVITPIIGGSKSGGAKILTAIALAALMFTPIGGVSLYSKLGTMAAVEGGGIMAALAGGAQMGLVALATNLAITGIQQVMAPDPSVDESGPESYLFNGAETNVVEGDPVPVLYGELRVPGVPISFDVTNARTGARSNYNINSQGDVDSELIQLEGYITAAENNSEFDFNAATVSSGPGIMATNIPSETDYARSQTITVVDLISEGPIYGLVNGNASVYLDNKPTSNYSDSAISLSQTGAKFTFSNNSNVVVANNLPSNINIGSFNQKRFLIAREVATATASGVTENFLGDIKKVIINTSTTFFTPSYVAVDGSLINPIVRLRTSAGDVYFEGIIESQEGTSAVCSSTGPFLLDLTESYTVIIDFPYEIQSYSAPTFTFTLTSPASIDGQFSGDLTGNIIDATTLAQAESIKSVSKFPGFNVTMRTGTLNQTPISDGDAGIASTTAFTQSISDQISGPGVDSTAVYGSNTQSADYTRIYSGTDFYGGGSTDKWSQTDQVKIIFSYSSLYDQGPTSIHRGEAGYKVELAIARDKDGIAFGNYFTLREVIEHYGKVTGPVAFQEVEDLSRYKPFTNFKLKITRLTDDDVGYEPYNRNTGNWRYDDEYRGNSQATITSLTAIIKEPLSYPYTAYARTTFSSQSFQNTPSRTYHCRGLKVLIPDTYTTREKSTTGVAQYTGTWSGTFKAEKEYTNNPAWVFYDILTNNRYGLGSWIQESDIDKFSLYRIARYCDELVDDGKGGLEPRFTTNVYLTKAADAYKVLKDLATIFRGMLYWMDGQLLTVADRAGDPIYNFSKANVINGEFSYEGTGNRTRSNQVVVTWNNPSSDYNLEALIVEDRENVIKTGKIITEEAVAFGATSEGQALRYGRWKLWTAINQTEIVSFKTAINAAYLVPGDIISVQDASRKPGNASYSGRISSTGTLSTTQIPLDRTVTLNSGSTYYLNVLIQQPGAFLNQDTATIGAVTYSRGDLIDLGSPGATTESSASNLVDNSGDVVNVTWSDYTTVETRQVSTGAGNVTSLIVSSEFSEVPKIQNIWTLTETISGVQVEGSAKTYKILAIREESKNEYSITAVEHYNEKFDSIDSDFIASVPDPIFSKPSADEVVPPPENLRVLIENLDNGTTINDVTIMWEPPSNYNGVNGYRITVEGHNEQINVSAGTTSITGRNIDNGSYTVWVATVNKNGTVSDSVSIAFTVDDGYKSFVTRKWTVPIGATSSTTVNLSSAGELSFGSSTYSIITSGNPSVVISYVNGAADTYIQDCSGVPAQNFTGMTDTQKSNNSHYIYYDASNTSDPLRLVKYYNDVDLGVWYLYDTGNGSGVPGDYWSSVSGETVDLAAGSQKVVGTNTSFTTDFQRGSLIKIDDGSPNIRAASVVDIIDDNTLLIDRTFSVALNSASYYKPQFTIDVNADSIFGAIRNESETTPPGSPSVFAFYPMSFIAEGIQGENAFSIVLSNESDGIPADSNGNVTNWTGTGTTITVYEGFTQLIYDDSSPYSSGTFRVTANGTGITPGAITADTSGIVTVGDGTDAISPDPDDIYIDFTIDIKSLSGAEVQFIKRQTFTKAVAGSSGTNAKTVRLTSDDYSIVYDTTTSPDTIYISNGTSPPILTVTAEAQGFTSPVYRFKVNGDIFQDWGTDLYISGQVPASLADWTAGFYGSNPVLITVEVAENGGPVEATDSVSIFAVAEGVDGNDGIDGYTVINTNSAHSFTASTDGTVSSYAGSGTTFEVFKGATQLTAVEGSPGPVAGQYSISAEGTGITVGSPTISENTKYIFSDHSNMTAAADTASITYTFNIEGTTTGTQKQTFSKSKAGINAAYVVVTGEQAFKFLANSTTPVNTTIQLSAQLYGGLTEYAWEYYDGSTWVALNVTQQTYTLAYDNGIWGSNTSLRIRCLSGSSFDEITIVKLFDADKTLSGYLTNENETYPANNDGTGYNISGAGGTFKVFQGIDDKTNISTFSITGGTSNATTWTKVQNGLTLTISKTTGVYLLSGPNWDSDSESFTLNATYGGVIISKVYTISKSKAGDSGSDGINARAVNLTVGDQVFTYDTAGSNPSPSSTTVTATALNTSGTVYYQFFKNNSSVQNNTTATYTYIPPSNFSSMPDKIEVQIREGSSTGTILARDQITLSGIKPGADGAAGANGLRTVQGYLYYEKIPDSPLTPPSAPGGNTYTFSTGVVSGADINDAGTTNVWKNSPNVQDPTSSNTHYTIRYYGTEASAGSSTIDVTYSGVVQYTNFTGVVTFSGGTFYEGPVDPLNSITTIDGGNITTGTISLDTLKSNTTYTEGSHSFILSSNTGTQFNNTTFDTVAQFKASEAAADCIVATFESAITGTRGYGVGAFSKSSQGGAIYSCWDSNSVWGGTADSYCVNASSGYYNLLSGSGRSFATVTGTALNPPGTGNYTITLDNSSFGVTGGDTSLRWSYGDYITVFHQTTSGKYFSGTVVSYLGGDDRQLTINVSVDNVSSSTNSDNWFVSSCDARLVTQTRDVFSVRNDGLIYGSGRNGIELDRNDQLITGRKRIFVTSTSSKTPTDLTLNDPNNTTSFGTLSGDRTASDWVVGERFYAVSRNSPTHWISGTVASVTGTPNITSINVTVQCVNGTSAKSDWDITHDPRKFIVNDDGDAVISGDFAALGSISAGGDITAYAFSDARLKDNLQVIPNALDKISLISGYTFEWNEKSNKEGTSVGVLAQEIQQVLPEVVIERNNGYLAVQYEKIIPLLVEAIKDLKKEIEELKNDNRS